MAELAWYFFADVRKETIKIGMSVCASVREDMSGNFVEATFRPFFFIFQMLKMRMRRGNISSISLYFLFFSLLNFWALGYL